MYTVRLSFFSLETLEAQKAMKGLEKEKSALEKEKMKLNGELQKVNGKDQG